MPLEKGVYSITSKRTTGYLPDIIGRFPVEDLSLSPKGIYALPDGVRPQYPHWLLIPEGDHLKITAAGAVATPMRGDSTLVAHISYDRPPQTEWVAVPTDESDCYTIELSDRSKGWVVSDEEGPRGYPVLVKELSGKKEDKEVFVIVRLDG